MDYSAANTELWGIIINSGILAGMLLLSNVVLRKIKFIQKLLIPTSVLAGFLLLVLRELNVLPISMEFMEMVTYHAIAIGFIATSLRVPNDKDDEFKKELVGAKSGAVIIGAYLVQGIIGVAITVLLSYTLCPGLFKAAGILLPMGFGQGPGQANNVGTSYETGYGFVGGQAFGLSVAAAGYLSACTVGVIYQAILRKKNKITVKDHKALSGSVTIDTFQADDEIPISQSIDRLSIQVALVIGIYFLTYLVSWGITSALSAYAPGLGNTLNSLIWGFNFIIGSLLAIVCRTVFNKLRKVKVMTRQYQNNYLLNRISGLAFDFMIICGIASIDISNMKGLWIPFIAMAVAGCLATLFYLKWVCKKVYPDYYYEGFFSMFGMLTGTISSGILLVREIDPNFDTPAANNLVTGSSFGILMGAPVLLLVGLAPQSDAMLYLVVGIMAAYLALLMLFVCKVKSLKKKKKA